MAKVNIKRKEVWKKIPNFEGYEISNYGQVRSYWKRIKGGKNGQIVIDYNTKPKHLKQQNNKKGYLRVCLKSKKVILVHKLILDTFVGKKPTNKHEARHLDGDNQNNVLWNLKWGTYKENTEDKLKHGGFSHLLKLNKQEVLKIRENKENLNQYELAKKYNVSQPLISAIQNYKCWNYLHGG